MTHQDPFSQAGKQLKGKMAYDQARSDQALTRLVEIEHFINEGIHKYYLAAMDWKTPDLYVKRTNNSTLIVWYGMRAGRGGAVLKGPSSAIFVTPEGATLIVKLKDWDVTGEVVPEAPGIPLNELRWQDQITTWLIDFIQKSELSIRTHT